MPLQLIADTLFALVDLLRIALFTAVPAFALTLAGQALFKRIRKKFKLSWIQAALLASFALILPVISVLYIAPYYMAYAGSAGQTMPEFFQPTAVDYIASFLFNVAKVLASAGVYTVLAMPLLFIAAFISEKLQQRFSLKGNANTFAAVYCTAFIAWLVVFFVFPWILNGLFYLLYWGGT